MSRRLPISELSAWEQAQADQANKVMHSLFGAHAEVHRHSETLLDREEIEEPAGGHHDSRHGIDVAELARRSELSIESVEEIENGRGSMPLDTMRRLCVGFDMALSELFDGFERGPSARD